MTFVGCFTFTARLSTTICAIDRGRFVPQRLLHSHVRDGCLPPTGGPMHGGSGLRWHNRFVLRCNKATGCIAFVDLWSLLHPPTSRSRGRENTAELCPGGP